MSLRTLSTAAALCGCSWVASAQTVRPLEIRDLFALRTVRSPALSPDGDWVAFTVSAMDVDADRSDTDVYMASTVDLGAEALRLTTSDRSETSPRWSPDGRYLAFLSSRDGDLTQVWLLDRRGGEATRLTEYAGNVSDLAWSPDASRLAVVVTDPDPAADDSDDDPPQPIVITQLQFKRDGQGYLSDRHRHLHLFDIDTRTTVQLTDGPYDDRSPVWAPDGSVIAFVSNRTREPDSNANTDIFLIEPQADAPLTKVTTSPGSDTAPAFSPDGRLIAYVAGGDPADIWYAPRYVAVVPTAGGDPRMLGSDLDRNGAAPRFTPDGRWILYLLEDAGNRHLARVAVSGSPVERLVDAERTVSAFDLAPDGRMVLLESQPRYPAELFLARGASLERVTRINDDVLRGLIIAPVERFTVTSSDGTRVDAFVTRPPDAPQRPLPTILRIHGGPVSQYSTAFRFEWQLFAANGYAVVAANPRGSSGYGHAFSRAIWADWGNKDFQDVMAAVDHVVEMGIADPQRLGVGGWSYGGILTNYVITQTDRFRAAISGASEVNYLSNYGTDHYQRQWEAELGLPWRNVERWVKMSPYFRVDDIVTPTLIMNGQDDWNVPALNSEQLYQALRRLGRETELVIYPGQSHGIRRPSFQRDRYERYLAWYDRYLRADATSP